MLTLIICLLIAAAAIVWLIARRKSGNMLFASNSAAGRHDTGNLTRLAEAAITTRYLLGKKGTDPETQVLVGGASDIPDFVITDEAEVAGEPVGCAALGVASGTLPMVASGAINIASVHFLVPDANGKVKALPSASATYYVIGKPLTSASADGDTIEVAHCTPYAVVVS